jgi:hypothetical protein
LQLAGHSLTKGVWFYIELDKLPRSFCLGQRTSFTSANIVTDPSVSNAEVFVSALFTC